MRTLKITLSYDGTRFVGWQRQAEGLSIQGLLEQALTPLEGGAVTVHGAGRTDAGVHALGQVASVRLTVALDAGTMLRALNARLPYDIRILKVEEAADGFNARFDAVGKTYRYLIRNAPVANPLTRAHEWHVREPLDRRAMQQAADVLVGQHDFAAFQSAGASTVSSVRTMTRAALVEDGIDLLSFEIAGNGFLKHMVRAIVGTLVDVGRGRRAVATLPALLAGRRRADAGPTAPPHGLFLVSVGYDSLSRPSEDGAGRVGGSVP